VAGRVIVDAKTGSSGSGAKAAPNTHHPQRSNSFYAYKPFTHQHVPEIEQELKNVGEWSNELIFMTHSLPVARGIFASIYTEVKSDISTAEARAMFAEFYRESFFVRLVEGAPTSTGSRQLTSVILVSPRAAGNWWCLPRSIIWLRERGPGGAEHELDVWTK